MTPYTAGSGMEKLFEGLGSCRHWANYMFNERNRDQHHPLCFAYILQGSIVTNAKLDLSQRPTQPQKRGNLK